MLSNIDCMMPILVLGWVYYLGIQDKRDSLLQMCKDKKELEFLDYLAENTKQRNIFMNIRLYTGW